MPPQAVTSFTVTPHPLGGELDLAWEYPTTLPTNWKPYIFKRRDSAPTSAEIQSYFAWLFAGAQGTFNYNGLFVFVNIDTYETALHDFGGEAEKERLKDGKHYYYKICIYNTDTGEYSSAVAGDSTPSKSVRVRVIDGKDLVYQAVMRVIDGQVNEQNERINLRAHVDVVKAFPLTTEKTDFILVSRTGGDTRYRFFDNFIAQHEQNILRGDVDSDLIEVTVHSIENPDRRDLFMNLFRAYKAVIRRYCMKNGAAEALVTIAGDSRDPSMNNTRLATGTFHVALLIENQYRYNDLDLQDTTIQPTFS